jgi:HEAT repeat protein
MPRAQFRSALLLLGLILSGWINPVGGQPATKPFGGGTSQKTGPTTPATDSSIKRINGKTLREWIAQTSFDDPSKRTQAILTIPLFGEDSADAVPALLSRLRDIDVSPRIKAVMALRFVGVHGKDVSKVVQALADRLDPTKEGQTGVRYEAALTMRRFVADAAPVIPQLIRGSHDTGSWELRHFCLQILRRAGTSKGGPDERVTQALLDSLRDPAYQVKLEALCGLGAMGKPTNPTMLARVVAALESGSLSQNRVYAVWAYAGLVAMSDKTSPESLIKLSHFLTPTHDLEVRCQAAQALGALGDRAKSRVPNLLAMLDDKEAMAVYGACVALSEIGDKSDRVIDAVIPLLDKDGDKDGERAFAACTALVRLGALNPKVMAALQKQTERTDKDSDKLKPMFRAALDEVKKTPKK